jgi:DNA-binding MarR family transcriptional regulator
VTLFSDGVKQNDIAEELGSDTSNVSRHIKRTRGTGLLDTEIDNERGKNIPDLTMEFDVCIMAGLLTVEKGDLN